MTKKIPIVFALFLFIVMPAGGAFAAVPRTINHQGAFSVANLKAVDEKGGTVAGVSVEVR